MTRWSRMRRSEEVEEPVWAEYRSACAGSLLPVSANRSDQHLGRRSITA